MLKSEWCCKQNLEYQVKTIAIGKFYETIEQLLVLYEKWVLNMSRLEVSVTEFYDLDLWSICIMLVHFSLLL